MSRLVAETVGRKVSRVVTAITASHGLRAKWHRYEDFDEAGNEIATATLEQLATGLDFLANGSGDTGINSYTGSSGGAGTIRYADGNADTIQKVIDIINGVGVGQPAPGAAGYMTRYRAGFGDARPGTSLDANSGIAIAAANILLGGPQDGLNIFLDGANTPDVRHRAAIGTGGAKSGGGQVFADHFESDYFSDTSGNRFPVRDAARRQEEQSGLARYQVHITDILYEAAFASDGKVLSIYDIDDNLVDEFPIGSADRSTAISEDNPVVLPVGSPAFVEGSGVGVLTDGALAVSGFIRIA